MTKTMFWKLLVTLLLVTLLAGTSLAEETEPSGGMFDPWFEVKTTIVYSAGNDAEWTYGNLRKEFTSDRPCYVRIGSSVVAQWHWGWCYGEGDVVTITYRFTGVETCAIEVSDGFLTEQPSNDPNVRVFTRTLMARKTHEEDVVIFRYIPNQECSVSLEILYDDSVHSKYDERSTVYLVSDLVVTSPDYGISDPGYPGEYAMPDIGEPAEYGIPDSGED